MGVSRPCLLPCSPLGLLTPLQEVQVALRGVVCPSRRRLCKDGTEPLLLRLHLVVGIQLLSICQASPEGVEEQLLPCAGLLALISRSHLMYSLCSCCTDSSVVCTTGSNRTAPASAHPPAAGLVGADKFSARSSSGLPAHLAGVDLGQQRLEEVHCRAVLSKTVPGGSCTRPSLAAAISQTSGLSSEVPRGNSAVQALRLSSSTCPRF